MAMETSDERQKKLLALVGDAKFIAHGHYGAVYRKGDRVIKVPLYLMPPEYQSSRTSVEYGAYVECGLIEKELHLSAMQREKAIYSVMGDIPGVVKCLGGQEESIELEYLPNEDLDAHLNRSGGSFQDSTICSADTFLQWFLQVAKTVARLYEIGITLQDLHPGNIMLDHNFDAVLCDFGCARTFTEQESSESRLRDLKGEINRLVTLFWGMWSGEKRWICPLDERRYDCFLGHIYEAATADKYESLESLVEDLEAVRQERSSPNITGL